MPPASETGFVSPRLDAVGGGAFVADPDFADEEVQRRNVRLERKSGRLKIGWVASAAVGANSSKGCE
jgi:hypothetical protein